MLAQITLRLLSKKKKEQERKHKLTFLNKTNIQYTEQYQYEVNRVTKRIRDGQDRIGKSHSGRQNHWGDTRRPRAMGEKEK